MEISSFNFDVFYLKNKEMRSRNESDSKHSMQERFGHSVLTLSVMLEINHLAAAVGLLDLRKHLMIGTVFQQV